MIVEVKQGGTFIPRWHGNKDEPSESQIRVNYRFLSAGDKRRYVDEDDMELYGTGEDTGWRKRFKQDTPGMVRAMVTSIDNYSISVGGKAIAIKTAADLYTIPGVHAQLVTEIEQAMVNASPDVDMDPT